VKLRPVKPRRLIKLLKKLGYKEVRIHGSHHIFEKGDVTITVPVHGDEEIGRGLLRKIIRDLGLTVEEFFRLLEEV